MAVTLGTCSRQPQFPWLPGAFSIAHMLSPTVIRQLTVNEFTTLIEGFIFNDWINETPQDPPTHPQTLPPSPPTPHANSPTVRSLFASVKVKGCVRMGVWNINIY